MQYALAAPFWRRTKFVSSRKHPAPSLGAQRPGDRVNLSAKRTRIRGADMDKQFIDDLSQRLAGVLPAGLSSLRRDLEKNFRAVLHANFEKMDLVTREEFEVQREVLSRTRAKLTALEKQVAELEARVLPQKGKAPSE
jgi:BMFP domain-containing protein YqiC